RLGPDLARRGRDPSLARRMGPRRGRPRRRPRKAPRLAGGVAPPVGPGAVRLRGLRRVPLMTALMILVAGPYRSGTDGDPARIQANVDAMTAPSRALWRRGHAT